MRGFDSGHTACTSVADRTPRALAETNGQLEEARTKIARLETELAHLPSMYASRAQLDLERASSENDQLLVQARALARKLMEAEEDKRTLSTATSVGPIGAPQSHAPIDSGDPAPPPHAGAGAQVAGTRAVRFGMPTPSELDSRAGPLLPKEPALDSDTTPHAAASNGSPHIYSDKPAVHAGLLDLLQRENKALKIDNDSLETRVSRFRLSTAAGPSGPRMP